jgi:hypothetical protein
LLPRIGIGHERFDTPADALKLGLLDNSLAQLHSLPAHGVLHLGIGLHKFRGICGQKRQGASFLDFFNSQVANGPARPYAGGHEFVAV